MNINRSYVSTQNTYAGNSPKWIVIHNTDNFSAGANALAHAKAQSQGDFSGMSAHYYVDDGDHVYQAAEHSRGCWHVGKNYGSNNLFGTVSNRNSVGVEMCVQAGYDYERAFQTTAELTRHLMSELGLSADRVVRHYDVCSKNCPSQIQAHGDWERFKNALDGGTSPAEPTGDDYTVQAGDTLTKIAGSWGVSVAALAAANGIGNPNVISVGQVLHRPGGGQANTSENAVVQAGQIHCNNFCRAGLNPDGIRGTATAKGGIMALQQAANLDYGAGLTVDGIWGARTKVAVTGHTVRRGERQQMVTALEILLMLKGYDPAGVESPGSFGAGLETAVRSYQADKGLSIDGIAGYNTFTGLIS